MKVYQKKLGLSLFFMFFSFVVYSQTTTNLKKMPEVLGRNSSEIIEKLIYDVQPTVYFEGNLPADQKEVNPVKIIADGVSLAKVFNATYNKSTVRLIEIRIDNEEDFNTKVNVDNYLNLFPNLKYLFFVFTYDCCAQFSVKEDCLEKKIVEMLNSNSNNNIQIVYSLSIND